MFKAFHIPLLQWHFIAQDWHPEFDEGPRWAYWRGHCQERVVRFPLWRWSVEVYGRRKPYRELVGFDRDLDWVLDEFDESFNALAVATLRYHMDFSVCDNRSRRGKYQALIDRLSEPHPHVCDTEEKRALFDQLKGTPIAPELKPLFADYQAREDAYLARINQARHDFVDIIPELWS